MDAELKAKWVEALRSGKYEQGTARLRRNGRFCCLGVLCDVVMPDAWVERAGGDAHPLKDVSDNEYIGRDGRLHVGLDDPLQHYVARMNDDGKPFAEIADYIERAP